MTVPSNTPVPRVDPPATANVTPSAARMPRLSIVVTTRNDSHGGNIKHRFQVFLNHLGEVCDRCGLDAELIVVEWNPDPEFEPLRQAMAWPDSKCLHIRVITVPPAIHRTFGNSDRFPLFQMIAKNVGIRRAKGEYVLATNVDVLFSEELARRLAAGDLRHDCFYRIDRHDVGESIIPDGLDILSRLAFCRRNVVRIQGQYGTYQPGAKQDGDPQKLHTEACGDFTLMAKERWLEVRGYPEFHLWSIFIDGLAVHAAKAIGLRQVILRDPCRIYHIEHQLSWALEDKDIVKRLPSLDYNGQYQPLCREMLTRRAPLDVNGPNWGFHGLSLDEWSPPSGNPPLTPYSYWIQILAYLDNRLYYRDQTEDSFAALEAIAREFNPSVVVELGTLGGLSLRVWTRSAPNARIIAVDLSFKTLRESTRILPLDLSRITLLEKNILHVDFSSLWGPEDRVLFFVDAHDLPDVPILRHVIETGVPALPSGSMVVVDDLWYSPEELTSDTVHAFMESKVLKEIDKLQCFEAHFAPYHGGGSFLGFREVVPLMEFVNQRGITLAFDEKAKNACFFTGKDSPPAAFDPAEFSARCGTALHNPLAPAKLGNGRIDQVMIRIASIYRQAGAQAAFDLLLDLARNTPAAPGIAYAMAVCLARMGKPNEAIKLLRLKLGRPSPHPEAAALLSDMLQTFRPHQDNNPGRRSGLTIFAMPKAFTGNVADIQRNAITSWTLMTPRPEIILFGDEPGITDICNELGLRHVPAVGRNDFGTPLVDALFQAAQELTDTDILAYVNSDIILFDDFAAAVDAVRGRLSEFLLVGRRWDYDMLGRLDFGDPGWAEHLCRDVRENGSLHAESGMDYFIFTPGLWPRIPPFAIGRLAWDNWLVGNPQEAGKAVVDCTESVMAVHQSHDYRHKPEGRQFIFNGIEAQRNRLFCGPIGVGSFTCGARWTLTADLSLARRPPQPPTFHTEEFKKNRLAWLLRQANRLLAARQPDLAEAKLDEAAELYPNSPEILVLQKLVKGKQAL